jgi:ParB-like chromosome segregation protein Spo0J
MTGVELARWGSAAMAGGLSQRSAAKLAGVSRRHLQRLLYAHADDPAVARDRLLADAIAWEQQGARTLAEAASRATSWLRQATSNPDADPKVVAAAFSATVAAGHRLSESGARRARRLAPTQPEQQGTFNHHQLLAAVAESCSQIRQLPAAEQERAFDALHQQLRGEQQPIDVEVIEAQGPELEQQPGPMVSPLL